MANLTINGKTFSLDVEPDTPLLWAIRENAGLTGTKYGCGIAQCGACTVHMDGVAMRSCGVPAFRSATLQLLSLSGTCRRQPFLPITEGLLVARPEYAKAQISKRVRPARKP